ncbi:GEVED domain-containing protein [Tenacibaculum sp. 190130A14a]
MTLELDAFKNHLAKSSSHSKGSYIIQLPNSKGELKKYSVKETPNFAPELARKFPMIKSYSAQGIDDPSSTAKISFGTDGLHTMIFSATESTIYIDPYTKNKKEYIVYKRSDLNPNKTDFECQVEDSAKKAVKQESSHSFRNANDGKLRTYRIAIACSAEYSDFHINRTTPAPTTDNEKKAAVLSAMNTSLTRINGVYEKDLGVRMELVGDNDKIVFLDTTTDGITDVDGAAGTMINEVQVIIDREIGNDNYDIGHIFSTKGSGLAGLGVVCVTGQKARGVTGRDQPINDPYDIDYVSHEIGHQFGATHTQNNSCNRTDATAVEPGSASTIMGYAGICAPNVQANSDDHFHAVSIAQMWNHVIGTGSCATSADSGNNAPTANAGSDYSIPKSTPFVLRGTATDADGTASLTYNWEQIDNEIGTMPPLATNTGGPMFRSLPSKTTPDRYMPALSTVIAGNTSTTWEVLPSVARELNFALTVRDNFAGGGNTARDDVKINVTDADAFTVTAPNSAVSWDTGSTQTVTWNKGTSDQAPINCAKVNIKLSVDGGLTFPITLKANTDNDGTENIVIPDNATTTARILVEAADNVFYNVNSTNFTINSTTPTFIFTNNTNKQVVCNSGGNTVTYDLNFNFVNGFAETATLSATGAPAGATVTFSPTTINADGNVTMTVSNLDGATQQDYTIELTAASTSVTQKTEALLKVAGSSFSAVTLSTPANDATDVSITPTFEWQAESNATSYVIQVSTDNTFATTVFEETATTNSFTSSTSLLGVTKYYWRVKPKNDCGEGTFSGAFSFTTETPSYCSSTFTDESGGTEHITNVTFNTINNNSGNDTTDGYQDFTSISTNVVKSQSYLASVTFNTGGYQDHCYIFIDWNKDYKFDVNTERYDLGVKTADVDTATLTIAVPNDAVLGETRMRVIIEYADPSNGYGEGPCDADHKWEWGETEDYTLVIDPPPTPDFTLANTTGDLSICNTAVNEQVFKLDYKALNGFNETVNLSVSGVPTGATAAFSSTTINSDGTVDLTLSNLNSATVGDYTVKVTATSPSLTKEVNIAFNVNNSLCKSTGNTDSQISVTNVKFNTINNTSTKTTGYSDYKAMNTEVIKGEKYALEVQVNSDGNNTANTYAWIDWNQNCTFDANEVYNLGTVTNDNTATSLSGLEITVPNDAAFGSTTMRISTKNSTDGDLNSCELNFDGEVEDYTITLTQDFTLTNQTGNGSLCNQATTEFVYTIDYKTINSFGENVTFTMSDVPTNATTALSSTSLNADGSFTVTVGSLDNVAVGDYTLKLTGTSTSITKSIDLFLSINDNICKSIGNIDSQISVTNVKFNTIDNASTKTTGYSDYKSMSTEVIQGEKYALDVQVNSDGNNTANTYAWIDWNQNCMFDANESYDLGSITNSTGATSNSGLEITVPADAVLGSTTLRIATKNSSAGALSSCDYDFDGEVEDYTITLTQDFTLTNQTGSGSVCNQATTEFAYTFAYKTFNSFGENVTLTATDVPTNATATFSPTSISVDGTFTLTLGNLGGVANGDYTIKVTGTSASITKSIDVVLSVNDNTCKSTGNNDSQISITNVKFNTIDNASTKTNGYSDYTAVTTAVARSDQHDVTVNLNNDGKTIGTTVWIDWNQNCLFDADETYTLGTGNAETLTITVPESAALGNTTMRVSTKSATDGAPSSCELDFDGEVEDYTITVEEGFATTTTLFNDLKVYPIPSNGKVTVDFRLKDKDMTTFRLFDFQGRLVSTQSMSSNSSLFSQEIELNASSGLYLLQIENAGVTTTRKVLVK